jgi:hypothetical protein
VSGNIEPSRGAARASRILGFLKSHHIQLALATGVSIIALAYVSKHVLPHPMRNLLQAFPPFLALIGEAVITQYKDSRFAAPWLWVLAILLSTAVVIALHLL